MLKKIIPNTLTSLNLGLGLVGICFAFNNKLEWSSFCILGAAVLDFLDGFVARLLKAGSEFGKQLDSLADVVSFGVLPALILFHMISIGLGDYFTPLEERSTENILTALIALLVAVFSAIRLARFNIDTRQTNHFIGLPTPANALFVASFPLILTYQYQLNMYYPISSDGLLFLQERRFWNSLDPWMVKLLFNPYFLVGYSLIISYLLNANIQMIALKFKGTSWKKNKHIYSTIGGIFLTFIFFLYYLRPYLGLFFCFITYIIVSSIYNFLKKDHEVSS